MRLFSVARKPRRRGVLQAVVGLGFCLARAEPVLAEGEPSARAWVDPFAQEAPAQEAPAQEAPTDREPVRGVSDSPKRRVKRPKVASPSPPTPPPPVVEVAPKIEIRPAAAPAPAPPSTNNLGLLGALLGAGVLTLLVMRRARLKTKSVRSDGKMVGPGDGNGGVTLGLDLRVDEGASAPAGTGTVSRIQGDERSDSGEDSGLGIPFNQLTPERQSARETIVSDRTSTSGLGEPDVGQVDCYQCGSVVSSQTIQQMVDLILKLPEGKRFSVLAPVVRDRKGEFTSELAKLRQDGFVRANVDGELYELSEPPKLDRTKKHTIEVFVDRLVRKDGIRQRLTDSVEMAAKLADGIVKVSPLEGEDQLYSEKLVCRTCGISCPEIAPRRSPAASPAPGSARSPATTPLRDADRLPTNQNPKKQRHYSATLNDSGRIPFANAIKALHKSNVGRFDNWLNKVLAREVEDAYAHAATQLKATTAEAILIHYKTWREFFEAETLPREALVAVQDALSALETAMSYDGLVTIRIEVDPAFRFVDNPLARVFDQITGLRNGHFNGFSADYVATQKDMVQGALSGDRDAIVANWSAFRLFSIPAGVVCDAPVIEIAFAQVAGTLLILSEWEKDSNARLAARCRRLAFLLAARADPDAVEYADLENIFHNARETVPAHAPVTRLSGAWKIALGGALAPAVDNGGAQSSTEAGDTLDEKSILRGVQRSFNGLVGCESFASLFAADLWDFSSGPRQSRGRVIWGNSGVGKTEIAQRLAGLREGFPALRMGTGQVEYVSGVDGKLEIKEIVDRLAPFSVLFVDEADKCLDPKSGMVSPAEATQLGHAIVTHFQRKPIYWVFLGVFSSIRGRAALTDDIMRATFGDELAHRLDYADWGLPDWSVATLLKAVSAGGSRRKVQYDDDAALLLAEYCVKTNGGVRSFDNLEAAIVRRFRVAKMTLERVNLAAAKGILEQRGVSAARTE